MTVPGNIDTLLLGGQKGYQISRSLRFNSADSAYLNRTPASAGNRQTFTWSCWFKRGKIDSSNQNYKLFTAYNGTNDANYFTISIFADILNVSGFNTAYRRTTQVFRDPSSWYHLVVAVDTTQATANNRIRVYINSTEITAFTTLNNPGLNDNTGVNTAATHMIGAEAYVGPVEFFNGYLTEIHFIDGQALTPSSFGETDTITGVWKPKKYSGTYPGNSFYLNFADPSGTTSTTLGKDSSGNGNNWTPNNFSVTAGAGNDSLVDSPTLYGSDTGAGGEVRGNYATFNATLASAFFGGATLKNGNLQVQGVGGVANTYARGTMAILGKAYAEFYFDVVTSPASVGVVPINDTATDGALYVRSTNVSYRAGGNKRVLGTESAYGASWVANDIIGVAVDPTANTVEFFKNGTSQGVITSSSFFAQGNCTFAVATDDVGSPQGYANFGQRPFAYTAPSGFKALCTTNLPEPTLLKGSSYMDAKLYTGNGSTQTISGLGFSPDLVWIKGRSVASSHVLQDTVRGATAYIVSNSTSAENTNTANDWFRSFTSDGFTVAASTTGGTPTSEWNANASTYVAWCWDAGSSTVTNTSGTISSQVRANASAGFSVVTYTANGAAAQTIGHGLGVAPAMVITKCRSAASSNWGIYHKSLGNTGAVFLNATNASTANVVYWNNTTPTASVFSVGTNNTDTNFNTNTMVAYCFAGVAGYSAFGSYTGNGLSDGPAVWLGFRPRFVLVKRTDAAANWVIIDAARNSYNAAGKWLLPDSSAAEFDYDASYPIDILSNGFKLRTSVGSLNSGTFIYAAFAENPFKYSLAR